MSTLTLCVVRGGLPAPETAPAALDVVSRTEPLPEADLFDAGGGWLTRMTRLAGAPFGLDLYFRGPPGAGWREVDAFALATVYGQVLWDDRAWQWHAESGRADSMQRLRELHDLALRCYRNHGDGERLLLVGG